MRVSLSVGLLNIKKLYKCQVQVYYHSRGKNNALNPIKLPFALFHST